MTINFQPANSLGNFLPEQVWFSTELASFQAELKRLLETNAKMINRKDTGQYETVEGMINQQYFGATPQVKRQIFRKVIECGGLPNAGTTSIPHGIGGIDNTWMFTRIYGTARDPTGIRWISIPDSGAFQVSVMVDATNVNLTTIADLTAFTYTIVVLEYYKL